MGSFAFLFPCLPDLRRIPHRGLPAVADNRRVEQGGGFKEFFQLGLVGCPKCGSKNLHRDEDVLDTWFSSGLWPFSTLGWPNEEKFAELKKFYPTSVLVTGRDIIFFWVARMIFTALFAMDEKPFSDVFINGLVMDAQGRKMSKSLGKGIDPLEIIDQYGADLRY